MGCFLVMILLSNPLINFNVLDIQINSGAPPSLSVHPSQRRPLKHGGMLPLLLPPLRSILQNPGKTTVLWKIMWKHTCMLRLKSFDFDFNPMCSGAPAAFDDFSQSLWKFLLGKTSKIKLSVVKAVLS